jgi:methanogenic corrinoid protein MtbC1
LLEAPPAAERAPADTNADATGTARAFAERILEAATRFRSADCEQALTLAIAMLPPSRLIAEVLEPLLREVGERWHSGEFSIAQERLVSTTVRKHIGLIVETYDRAATLPAVVFATLPGERHELGLLMAALVCASHGFKVHYLGPDLPPQEIARYAKGVAASVVALSVVLLEGAHDLPAMMRALVAELGDGTLVWLGGSGTQGVPRDALPASCAIIRDQEELTQCLELIAH